MCFPQRESVSERTQNEGTVREALHNVEWSRDRLTMMFASVGTVTDEGGIGEVPLYQKCRSLVTLS